MSVSIRIMDYIKCIIDVNGNTRYYIRLDRNWLKRGDRSYDKRFTILSSYPEKISENCYEYEIDVEKYNGISPEIGDFFVKDEESNLCIAPGWRELSKGSIQPIQPLTEKSLKEFLYDVYYGRKKEREKKRKEEKKREEEVNKLLEKNKVNFDDLPVDVQAYYMQYIINPYYAIGIDYYNELKEKYPEYI